MPKLRVCSFSVSLDGYGAGPEQSLDNPLGIGGETLHEWVFPTRTFRKMSGRDDGSTGVDDDYAARGFARRRCVDHGPQHVRARTRRVARRKLEGMVGRQSALPLRCVCAHPPSARADRDGGRHHLPFRDRRHPRGTRTRDARPRTAATCGSVAGSRRSGSICRRGSSTRCTLPCRRSSSAPAKTCSPGSICRNSGISASSMFPRRAPRMSF